MAHLASVTGYKPGIHDQILENKIHMASVAMLMNTDPSKRQALVDTHRKLHASRSVEYVAWMERKQGISA